MIAKQTEGGNRKSNKIESKILAFWLIQAIGGDAGEKFEPAV